MINKNEIDEKAEVFQINTSNVQRDYVFGWVLAGMYGYSDLKNKLVLKGGNCFRKAYFENTRFSRDLDFSCEENIPTEIVSAGFNTICDFVSDQTGIIFKKEETIVAEKKRIDKEKKIYDVRLYFKDFYGQPSNLRVSVRFDITNFDRIYLPVQERYVIHPYSDAGQCEVKIKCIKLEELLASKLKCLLQRRHSADLYDYVYSVFINKSLDVSRSEILRVFFKKTIYEKSPGVVRGLLLDLPFEAIRRFWDEYIVVPRQAKIVFDQAIEWFKQDITEFFPPSSRDNAPLLFFPSHLRNPIMEAGSNMTLLKVTYDGVQRIVEPYSLKYKVRKDGVGREYFYAYDQTGGRSSGPGIKAFVSDKVESIENISEKFEPRFLVELSKAGEFADKTYFGTTPPEQRPVRQQTRMQTKRPSAGYKTESVYIIKCPYCNKQFRRKNYKRTLNPHKDKFGNRCFGKIGLFVGRRFK